MPGAYTMTLDEALAKIAAGPADLTEVHIVNGLHPGLPFSYYEDLLRGIQALRPRVHLKAFTAVEIAYFSERYGMTVETVLDRLRAAGLGSLPGGGAEIFAARVRKKICREKVDADGWLQIHRSAHRLGLRSNCTMLYGHIETAEERVDHLLQLRALQDETGGFQTFIPLAFHNENNALERLPGPTACDDLRLFAAARLLLDNVPHLKAYWAMLGVKTAQTALWFGADDLDGTVQEEKIYKMAGSRAPDSLGRADLVRLIRAAGREPVERDTLYGVVAEGEALSARLPRIPRRALEVVA
jgi:aminodeoxyfutalosine synthase